MQLFLAADSLTSLDVLYLQFVIVGCLTLLLLSFMLTSRRAAADTKAVKTMAKSYETSPFTARDARENLYREGAWLKNQFAAMRKLPISSFVAAA